MRQIRHFTRVASIQTLLFFKSFFLCVILPQTRSEMSAITGDTEPLWRTLDPPATTLENYPIENQEQTSGLGAVSIVSIVAGSIGCICVLVAILRYAMMERGRRARTYDDEAILEASEIRLTCELSSKYQHRDPMSTITSYSRNGTTLLPKGCGDVFEKKNGSVACEKIFVYENAIPIMRESSITSNRSTSLLPNRYTSEGSIIIEERTPQVLPIQLMRPTRPPPLPPGSSDKISIQSNPFSG